MLDRQVAAIVWRTFGQDRSRRWPRVSRVPVVNALTDDFHPCQILADLAHGRAAPRRLAALPGHARSPTWATARTTWRTPTCSAARRRACTCASARPEGYLPDADVVARAHEIAARDGRLGDRDDVRAEAVAGADVVATDTWVSMGEEAEAADARDAVRAVPVDATLLARAAPDALVLHCLPAYRGKEITAEVIDGPQSVVWDEAENRLHAQKALLAWLLEQG